MRLSSPHTGAGNRFSFSGGFVRGFARTTTALLAWVAQRIHFLFTKTPTQGAEWLSIVGAIIVVGVLALPGDYLATSAKLRQVRGAMGEGTWTLLFLCVFVWQFLTVIFDEDPPARISPRRAHRRIAWKTLRTGGGLFGLFVWLWFVLLAALGGGLLALMGLPFAMGSAWAALIQAEEIRSITDNCARFRRIRLLRFARRCRRRARQREINSAAADAHCI